MAGERNLARDVLAKILFARKHQLDRRSTHLVGNFGQNPDVLEFEAVAETSAHPLIVKRHLLRLEADRLRRDGLHSLRALMTDPDFHLAVGDNRNPIERLQRLMAT